MINRQEDISALRAKLETANKIIDEYQQNIIPGFRERAENAEKERDDLRRQIEELQKKNDELLAENAELRRQVYLWKVVAEDVTQSHEYWHNRALQIEQAAQALVEYTKSDGLICDTPILIDNLATVLAEREGK